jgi:hypothetical protein
MIIKAAKTRRKRKGTLTITVTWEEGVTNTTAAVRLVRSTRSRKNLRRKLIRPGANAPSQSIVTWTLREQTLYVFVECSVPYIVYTNTKIAAGQSASDETSVLTGENTALSYKIGTPIL